MRKKTLGRYGFHLIDHHLGFEVWDNMLSAVWIGSFRISPVLAFMTPTTHTTPHSTRPPRSPSVPQATVAFWTAVTVLYRVHHHQSSFALISDQLHTSPALTNPPWQCECVPVCLSWGRCLKWMQLVSTVQYTPLMYCLKLNYKQQIIIIEGFIESKMLCVGTTNSNNWSIYQAQNLVCRDYK